jgi:proteasome lid subunit RPN8/RPN11
MTFFAPVSTWRIPEPAFAASLREMACDGVNGDEGVALWLGRRAKGHAEVTHLVILRGSGVIKRPDQLVIQAALVNEVTDLAIELGLVLVGQIHSHDDLCGIDLSYADRTFGITVPYYLSLVAPGFALRPQTHLDDCGVHVFEPANGFRRLSAAEVSRRIQVVPAVSVPVLTVGEGNS